MKRTVGMLAIVGIFFSGCKCCDKATKPSASGAPVSAVAGLQTPPTDVAPAVQVPTKPRTEQRSSTGPAARGEYLAAISGCAGCHTPRGPGGRDGSRLYAGTPGREGGGGTPNITPDPETGIGKWTDDQIVMAIREGKRPDGTRITAKMPSPAYHKLTDEDARAIVAYLRIVPPVVNAIARTPADKIDKSKLLNLPPATGNVDLVSDPVKHGEYIVGMMRCVGCHTPRAGAFAGKPWAGGNEFSVPGSQGALMFYSSNLTSDPATGIGTWKIEDIAASVRELIRPDGTKIHGPMNGRKEDYEKLSDADAAALGAFFKAIPPIVNKVPAANTSTNSPGKS